MITKLSAATASVALIFAAVPSYAQSAPVPASETVEAESALFGGGNIVGYALLATVLAGFVYGIIEFSEDSESDYAPVPVSP